MVPLFRESRAFLEEARSATPSRKAEDWVISMLGGEPNKNRGTTFKKIMERAGVKSWPKPFQNLRSSRQTELEQEFPTYVFCA